MKIFNKSSIKILLVLFFVFGLTGPIVAHAATAPDLGVADGYSVFGKAGVTNTGAGTHVWGNAGADATNPNPLIASQVSGSINVGAGVAGVESAITSAYGALAAWGADGAKNLSTSQTVTPGVYTVIAPETLTGTITLDGAGVYIFRSASAYHFANSAQINLINGASACNVFWIVGSQMTIGTSAHVEGTIIANTELISLATGATLKGRAFSRIAQVTLDTNQITEPVCAVAAPVSTYGGRRDGTITVVKNVINDNGGTKTIADFPLFVGGKLVVSGETNNFTAPAPAYAITETSDPNYTQSFSGDCPDRLVSLSPGANKFCIVTNNDIGAPVVPPVPPLIDVVKVPTPLALPAGPGLVNYAYTLRNIGTVPVTNITMVGDTCSPIVLTSGDVNADAKLDVNETWVYHCSTNLTETHTNTVVATGWANGISATDIASATVVVGIPIVPPLIHVTKIPNPLTLLAAGGKVTYTEKITNPGTVPLTNVGLSDDKCTVKYISGDTNNDSNLDINETWTYTCQTSLTQTTTNTATATGWANGLMVKDLALATVVVAAAVPALPNTGVNSIFSSLWGIVLLAGILTIAIGLYIARRKQTN